MDDAEVTDKGAVMDLNEQIGVVIAQTVADMVPRIVEGMVAARVERLAEDVAGEIGAEVERIMALGLAAGGLKPGQYAKLYAAVRKMGEGEG